MWIILLPTRKKYSSDILEGFNFLVFFLKFIISVSFISGLSEGNEKFLRESSLSFFLETKFLNRLYPFSWKQNF